MDQTGSTPSSSEEARLASPLDIIWRDEGNRSRSWTPTIESAIRGAAAGTRFGCSRPRGLTGFRGGRFPASAWSFPTKDEMADYVAAYATRFDLPIRTKVRVDRLCREARPVGGRHRATIGSKPTTSSWRPEASNRLEFPVFASDLNPDVRQLHSSQYRTAGSAPGR